MPALTGSELAKRILALRPETPMILCTGYSATINEHSALELGMKAYLNKPVGIGDLARKVRDVLDEGSIATA
jgi:CheY-like chemotaxis protein